MIAGDFWLVKFALVWAGLQFVCGEREHKVHNIVLYPDKHSWCRTTPIKQVIASPGFDSVTIDNNICVGTCFSYSIPKTNPAEPGELIGPYCDSCQPSEIKCYHVNLRSGTQKIQKRVQIIQNCTCISCDKTDKHDCEIIDKQTTDELPLNMLSIENNDVKQPDELPDLFDLPKPSKNPDLAKKWKKLLESVKHEFDAEQNSTNEENLIQKHKLLLEHQELEHNEEDNEKIEEDLEDLPDSFGLEGSASQMKGAHIGMGIQKVDPVENEEPKPHHHHLGEVQQIGLNLEQIVNGPHGSLVLTPKLQLDSDHLKPIDEGLEVSYENHHHHHHKKHNDEESN